MEKTGVLTLIEVKKINQKRVYEFLYRQKTASKLEIANAINVSLPTVASSLNALIAQGLVSNCGVYDSTGGRKAQIFCCNALARIAIGVELLKERVQIVAVDLYGNTLDEDFLELGFENEASYYSKLGEWINQFVKALPYTDEQNLGVCISLQGLISDDGETITYSEILKCTGVSRSTYQKYIDYPVSLVHDTEAAAQAEVWYRDDITDDAVYIALNRNLGGTLILGNRSDTFKRNGLIEHITLDPDGPLCYCGKQGCAETFCSANSLKEKAGMEFPEFFKKVHSGDSRCSKLWKSYLHYLARLIDDIRMIINCDFIIGGYLLKYINQSDIDILADYVDELCVYKDYGKVGFKISKIGDKAPKLGAALRLINDFIANI